MHRAKLLLLCDLFLFLFLYMRQQRLVFAPFFLDFAFAVVSAGTEGLFAHDFRQIISFIPTAYESNIHFFQTVVT